MRLSDNALDHLRSAIEAPDLSATPYEIQREIGRGGMGTVYEAFDGKLQRTVALKVLDGIASGGDIAEEARIMARLEHPAIVPIYDAGVLPDGRPYYVMRLVSGQRLDRYLAREVSIAARLAVFEKVCDAVAFAHDRGVIHLDLKPQNVMVGSFGEVSVLDWGIAKNIDAPLRVAAGTPEYMAPEQRKGSAAVDRTADIYALGAILKDTISPPRPRPLAAIEAKAMAAEPSDRYASAKQLSDDVLRYLDRMPVTAYRENTWERLVRFAGRNRILLLLLAAYTIARFAIFFFSRH